MYSLPSTFAGRSITISFASPKGGVGKSTLCAAVGGSLVARGAKVKILDLDQNRVLANWSSQFPEQTKALSVEQVREGNLIARIQQLWTDFDGFILLDVAGALSKATIAAASLADLTITPSKMSVPDITQAVQLHRELVILADRIGKPILHRLLFNEASPLWPTFQREALANIRRTGLHHFQTIILQRVAFPEMFFNGLPPHQADTARESVTKAIDQIDSLTDEILAVIETDAPAVAEPDDQPVLESAA